jgi:peptide-methionine (S)-S-oxide reductase
MADYGKDKALEVATLAGGCFWCLEAVYDDLKGVMDVVSGYSGGKSANPSYEAVCTGATGHAETVQVTFDPAVVSYRELLEVFFSIHDPTSLNRQGADSGTQYRSGIYFSTPAQQKVANDFIREVTEAGTFDRPIVTEVVPLTNYVTAEAYHQDFFANNPNQGYCVAVAGPKVAKFRKTFTRLAKS